jgi:hypothetical protein
MILKILVVLAVLFGIKTVLKASKIVHQAELKKKEEEKPSKDDIVEAEYKVVKD